MKKIVVFRNTLLLLVGLLVGCFQVQADVPADAQAFWKNFKTAVVANKPDKVVSLANFPFKTRGEFDDDPIIKHDKAGFKRIYQQIFSQSSYDDFKKTVGKVVEKKTKITKKDMLTPKSMRVDNLVFNKVNGKWRFTFAYVVE